jgi:predicted ATP-dependent endonuclease of OLD family
MQISTVRLLNYRSFKESHLSGCGSFNVLIGKNNTGKSNILSAIRLFFGIVSQGKVATLDVPPVSEIDYYNRNTSSPLEISILYRISASEAENLNKIIHATSSQKKKTPEIISDMRYLYITAIVPFHPHPYGITKELLVGRKYDVENGCIKQPQIILSVDDKAVEELCQRLEIQKHLLKTRRKVQSVKGESSGWKKKLDESVEDLENLAGTSDSFPRKIKAISDLNWRNSKNYRDGILDALKKELSVSVTRALKSGSYGTIFGRRTALPNQIESLLKEIPKVRILHEKEAREPIGSKEARRLIDLSVSRSGRQTYDMIRDTCKQVLNVRIDPVDESAVAEEDNVDLDVDDISVGANGSGIRSALRLIVDYMAEKPDVLMIEEPEIHLHPGQQRALHRYLKRVSADCQVFISTHSTSFVDNSTFENIYLVSKDEGTSIRRLKRDNGEEEIVSELSLTLSSLFMFDRLVFVEGPSDSEILSIWAAKLDRHPIDRTVGFIKMEGVTNFKYFASGETLSFLKRRGVRMWFMRDRDEATDAELQILETRLGKNAKFVALQKRELENYMLCPRVLVEFIKRKQGHVDGDGERKVPTEEDVQHLLSECADKLKHVVVYLRVARNLCKPIYLQDRRMGKSISQTDNLKNELTERIRKARERLENIESVIPGVFEETENEVNMNWKHTREDLVPGARLIQTVCKRYGVTYKKKEDGPRLANLMRPEEISDEIRRFILNFTG